MKRIFVFLTIIILASAMAMLRFSSLKKRYHEEVSQAIISGNLASANNELLTEEDIGYITKVLMVKDKVIQSNFFIELTIR